MWWADLLGYHEDPDDPNEPGHEECMIFSPDGSHRVLFIDVPDEKQVRNRVHFDLRPTDRPRDEEVERVAALGASVVQDCRTARRPRVGRHGRPGGQRVLHPAQRRRAPRGGRPLTRGAQPTGRSRGCDDGPVTVARSMLLFALAAVAEIGGAWLVWQGVREHRGWVWIGAGVIALGLYGFVATLQPDANFGRILAAYGGVFVAGSLAWGMVVDGFRPDRYDVAGALLCLVGVAVIMYAPRPG